MNSGNAERRNIAAEPIPMSCITKAAKDCIRTRDEKRLCSDTTPPFSEVRSNWEKRAPIRFVSLVAYQKNCARQTHRKAQQTQILPQPPSGLQTSSYPSPTHTSKPTLSHLPIGHTRRAQRGQTSSPAVVTSTLRFSLIGASTEHPRCHRHDPDDPHPRHVSKREGWRQPEGRYRVLLPLRTSR